MFRLRTAGLLLATALAATAVGTPPAAAGIFFVGSGNEFGTINPVTGTITTLGTASTDTANLDLRDGILERSALRPRRQRPRCTHRPPVPD